MAKVKLLLDKRTPTILGKYPLRIKITHKRKTNFISLDSHLSMDEYKTIFEGYPSGEYLIFKIESERIVHRASIIADSLNPFDFKKLKIELQREPISKPVSTCLYGLIDEKIIKLKNEGRIKTKESNKFLHNTLKKYTDNLIVDDIDVLFLESFEKWYINKRTKSSGVKSDSYYNTLGVLLRNLRSIVNTAMNKKQVSGNYIYPFKAGLYTIQVKSQIKKFLSLTDIENLISYNKFDNEDEKKSLDYWKLLYYCNGINFIDLITLRWDQIKDNIIYLHRTKTKRTTRGNPNPIRIPIIEPLKDLMDIYSDKSSPYIFGFLNENPTPEQIQHKKNKTSKLNNPNLTAIGKKLNFKLNLTLKTSRDSYANTLKKKGRSMEEISEMMGHQNGSKITHSYLDTFDDEKLFEINNVLIK